MGKYYLFFVLLCVGVHSNAFAWMGSGGEHYGRLVVGSDTLNLLNANDLLRDIPGLQASNYDWMKENGDTSYCSIWRLMGKTLYLEKLESYTYLNSSGGKHVYDVDILSILKGYGKRGRVEASWYTGIVKARKFESSSPSYKTLDLLHRMEDGETNTMTTITYDVKKGKVITKTKDEWTHEYASVGSEVLLNKLFNPSHLPWNELDWPAITVYVTPFPDGSLKSFHTEIYKDNKKIVLDKAHPFAREVEACVKLIPDWEIVRHNGEIVPLMVTIRQKGHVKPPTYWVANLFGEMMDSLMIKGETYSLLTDPLEMETELYARLRKHLKDEFSQSTIKGYVAQWEVKGGQFFLKEIRGGKTGRQIPLSIIEPGFKGDALPATWFTGELWARKGEPITNRFDLNSTYTHDAHFYVRNGQVLGQGLYENHLIPMDTAVENRCDREIRESPEWAQFPELRGCTLTGDFMIYPNMDGTVQRIELKKLTVTKNNGQDGWKRMDDIRNESHPYVEIFMKSLEKLYSLELRLIHGEIHPLPWLTRVEVPQ